ncbi:Methyltransferase domain [Rhizoctonia solani]|uniref:Methyltransferase domain n=1 Tax=Rhizoctonia solani TaxID=456999 RepID=A0A8H7IIQ0_9AGAM|nr:Methyltransferase domain [Rhizoctonia solani]
MAAVAYHHRPAPVPTPPPHMHPSEMDMDPRPPSPTSSTSTVTSSRTPDFFRQLHERQLNCMNTTYMLPADEQEMKRMDIEHRMMKFIMAGKNYVGPVAEALTKVPGVQRRVLDCGTGNGLWAIEMADEFDWVEVTGVDLAPIQPRKVPPNCVFELFDLDGQRLVPRRLPYPDSWFDVVHARSVYTGVRQYGIFLRELARVLRPGGVAIFAEVDSTPFGEKKHRIPLEPRVALLAGHSIGTRSEERLANLESMLPSLVNCEIEFATRENSRILSHRKRWSRSDFGQKLGNARRRILLGLFRLNGDLIMRLGSTEPVILSIGQLAWMNYDNLLLALRPLLLDHGITPERAAKLIEDAQENLYHPKVQPHCCWHIVHARKAR